MRHPQVVPSRESEYDMDAVTATALHEVHQRRFKFLEIGAQLRHPVDQEHDIGRDEFRDLPRCVARPQHRERVDRMIAEHVLSCCEHGVQFLKQSQQAVPSSTRGHAANMGEPLDAHETAAGQVHSIDADLAWCLRERNGCGDRSQERAAAGLRRTKYRHMSPGAAEIEKPRILPLFRGVVEQTDGHQQTAVVARCCRPVDGPGERESWRKGRQPDGLHEPAARAQPIDGLIDECPPNRWPGELIFERVRVSSGETVEGGEHEWFRSHGIWLDQSHCVARDRTGHIAGAKPAIHRRVDLEVAVARDRGQVEGVGRVEDDRTLGLRECAQPDTVRQIGLESA